MLTREQKRAIIVTVARVVSSFVKLSCVAAIGNRGAEHPTAYPRCLFLGFPFNGEGTFGSIGLSRRALIAASVVHGLMPTLR